MLPKHPTSGKPSTYGISIELKQPIKLKVIQYTLLHLLKSYQGIQSKLLIRVNRKYVSCLKNK